MLLTEAANNVLETRQIALQHRIFERHLEQAIDLLGCVSALSAELMSVGLDKQTKKDCRDASPTPQRGLRVVCGSIVWEFAQCRPLWRDGHRFPP